MAKSAAIIDKYSLEQIGSDLRNKQEAYYVIFRIILDTGIPLEEIPSLRVCDINKNALTFMPIHKGFLRTEQLSEETQAVIKAYVAGKREEDYAFPAKSSDKKPLNIRSFQFALAETSNHFCYDPPITAMSLKKTFIYNLYMHTHDPKKIYKITGVRSLAQLYEYLGIDAPPKDNEDKKLSPRNPQDVLVGDELSSKTRTHVNSVLDSIDERLANGLATYQYCQEALTMIATIEKGLARFEELSDNPVSKIIHKKSGDD